MIGNYLKVALRNLRRFMAFSIINILSFSIGILCFMLIICYIQFELSFDRFHHNHRNIYRVIVRNPKTVTGDYSIVTPEILSRMMRENYFEVQAACISLISKNALFQTDKYKNLEDGLFVDNYFMTMFSFPLVFGDKTTALNLPDSIVISDGLAMKAFGRLDVLGEVIHFKNSYIQRDLNITGIIKQPPKNSHLLFSYLISTSTMAVSQELDSWFNSWDVNAFITYLELKKGQSTSLLEEKIVSLMKKAGRDSKDISIYLQPLKDIHLYSRNASETGPTSKSQRVYVLSFLALIILFIACLNSINMASARSATRSKEIGARKSVGATRAELIRQFIGESLIHSSLAMCISLALFLLTFRPFGNLVGINLIPADINILFLFISVIVTVLFVGIISGLYPALVLSALQPHIIFKDYSSSLKGARVRKLFVLVQFSAITLSFIATIVVSRQMSFIQQKDPGFEKENILIIPFLDEELIRKAGVIKAELLKVRGILGVTLADSIPTRISTFITNMHIENENGEMLEFDFNIANVDYDFLKVFGIEIMQGNLKENKHDMKGILVNEEFVRRLGWTNPLDRLLMNAPIIGIIKNFHFETLHKKIEPLVIRVGDKPFGLDKLGIRISGHDYQDTLKAISAVFSNVAATRPTNIYFFKEAFDVLYRNEHSLKGMFEYFRGISLILGCIGLLGLASFSVQRRSKEMGIRKLLGASLSSLNWAMCRELIALVIAANLVAWPLGYYLMNKWLQSFAYRCNFGVGTFLIAGLVTVIIAIMAISTQTIRVSIASPLKTISRE